MGIVHTYGTPGGVARMFAARKIGYDEVGHLDYDLCRATTIPDIETATVGNITHIILGSMATAAYAYDEVTRPVVATLLFFPQGRRRLQGRKHSGDAHRGDVRDRRQGRPTAMY